MSANSDGLLVVGGDAGGMSAAATARRLAPELGIRAFERGPYTSYSACGIPYFVAGLFDDAERLISRRPAEFAEQGIEVVTEAEVVDIDLDRREVTVARRGRAPAREGFDQLVYATGAEAVVPPIPGAEAIEPVRTVDAAERFRDQLLNGRGGGCAVVIGASYLGLEMAEALIERGMSVTLVDRADQVMTTLDADMAAEVQAAAEGKGIRVLLGGEIEEIRRHPDGRARSVKLVDEELEADHVVLSTGVRPAVALAEAAGLEIGPSGALAVDDHQRCAGAEGVFAAGDCAESWHRLLERPVNVQLGTHANKQGRVAGTNAAGGDASFPGLIGTAVSKICRYEVARTGLSEGEAADAGIDVVSASIDSKTRAGYFPGTGPIRVKLVADAGGRLLGGQIVGVEGAAKRIDVLAACVWSGMAVDELEMLDLSYAPPFSGVYDPLLVAARATAHAVRAAA
ncbi:FAD-dependent oxidoreductase [soil metagenome]|jgi:NADPH-dependent 2,4-dienoyl-CoA reductase/sulfur reductase-like enzyme|nr:FAD-dependent oxidoreductase [Actinomycetota bacterium]